MILQDEQGKPYTGIDSYEIEVCTPSAFAGGTTNARGDDGGTGDPFTLFNVTGEVVARIIAVCTVNLASAGGGTLQVGTVVDPDAFIAATTATDIDAGELWHDATPDNNVEALTVAPEKIIVGGADIVESTGTADITAGNIKYICLWRPLTPGSAVKSAVN